MLVVRRRRRLCSWVWLGVALLLSSPAAAVTIDFESGLDPSAYALEGVWISSDQQTLLGQVSNVGTSLVQGFHVFAPNGAEFPGSTIDLSFDPGIVSIAFDWYTSTLGTGLEVSVFGPEDSLLGTFWDPWDSTLMAEGSGSGFHAGHFSIDLGEMEIRRIFIADDPVGSHIVALDNLSFVAVPEPASGCLLVAGLVLCLVWQRRRRQARPYPKAQPYFSS